MAHTACPACPKCGAARSTRVRRNGFIQNVVLPRLDRYPWECAACRSIFTSKNRGAARTRRRPVAETSAPAEVHQSVA